MKTVACYDCGALSEDTVCTECLRLADELEYERRYCRDEHSVSCECWRVSQAAMVYAARLSLREAA